MGIEQYLQQILSARYGKDVRQSIHDSIYEINEVAKKAEYDASTAPESAKAYAQAALASEQAAEDYKTAAEQAAEQAMSGTPEGYADLVAKVNSIYRQTATSYNVVGTSEGSALAHTIYGMSVQDGTPTPDSPVEIESAKADFRCVGKNLIKYPFFYVNGYTNKGLTFNYDESEEITVNGTVIENQPFFILLDRSNKFIIKPNVEYTLSLEGNDKLFAIVYFYNPDGSMKTLTVTERYDDDGTPLIKNQGYASLLANNIVHQKMTFSVNDNTIIGVQLRGLSVGETYTNAKAKVNFSLSNNTDFVKYQGQDIITDITLRAIEVSSTDDYTYERDGKYYIADTIDWSEDEGYKITRRVASSTISELTGFIRTTNWQGKQTFVYRDDTTKRTPSNHKSFALSSGYEPQIRDAYISGTASDYGIFTTPTGEIIFAMPLNSYSSKDDFLADQGNQNVQYVLITPTTEPITSEQAQALLSLKTYDEATSISATGDIEPSLDLEYSKDRNTALALTGHNLAHKNALKLNDINTALIELGGN